jgi:hypothetical protein
MSRSRQSQRSNSGSRNGEVSARPDANNSSQYITQSTMRALKAKMETELDEMAAELESEKSRHMQFEKSARNRQAIAEERHRADAEKTEALEYDKALLNAELDRAKEQLAIQKSEQALLKSQSVENEEFRGRLMQVKREFEHAQNEHEQQLAERDERIAYMQQQLSQLCLVQSRSEVLASPQDLRGLDPYGARVPVPTHHQPKSNDGSWVPSTSGPQHQNISVISAPPIRSAGDGTYSNLDSRQGELEARDLIRYDMPLQAPSHASGGGVVASSNGYSEPLVEVPASELGLLESCKRIIDAAATMQCGKCGGTFPTLAFYDHIFQDGDCDGAESSE